MARVTNRERLVLEATSTEPQRGLLLAALEEARGRTHRELATVTDDMVAWRPPMGLDSIGQVLYHVALIEADWLFNEILELPEDRWPAWMADEFPTDVRDSSGRLSNVPDEPLEPAVTRLDRVRAVLTAELGSMPDSELHRPRSLSAYDVTPAWVLHHLLQHEAEHRAHVALVRDLYLSERGEA
jgi:uncharacterized damage-inducible protein DinB